MGYTVEPDIVLLLCVFAAILGLGVGVLLGMSRARLMVSRALDDERDRQAFLKSHARPPTGGYSVESTLSRLAEQKQMAAWDMKLPAGDPLYAPKPQEKDPLDVSPMEIPGWKSEPSPLIVTAGEPKAPKPGDMRVVEITSVVPHLFRLDRYHDTYERSDHRAPAPYTVPAGWAPCKGYGKHRNGLFLTAAEAKAAMGGPVVVAEKKVDGATQVPGAQSYAHQAAVFP